MTGHACRLLDHAALFGDVESGEQAIATLLARAGAPSVAVEAATALLLRYEASGAARDLWRAIELLTSVTDEGGSKPELLACARNNLGVAYERCYRTWGTDGDLETAASLVGDAGRLCLEAGGDPRLELAARCNLAAIDRARYRRTGGLKHLDAAALFASAAVKAIALADDPQRPHAVLAGGFETRPLLLAAAVARPPNEELGVLHRSAVSAAVFLTAMGIQRDRFRHSRRLADIDPAIDLMRRYGAALPEDMTFAGALGAELGDWLRGRFEVSEEPDDLNHAITHCERAFAASRFGAPGRARRLRELAECLVLRYETRFVAGDGDRAVSLLATALEESDAEAPERAALLRWTARVSAARFVARRDDPDRDAATRRFREACATGLEQSPAEALHAAREWGAFASLREAWGEATEAYREGLAAIDRLLREQLLRAGRATWMRDAQGLAAEAAYALARAGDPEGAVLALERFRTRLLAETLSRRAVTLRALVDERHQELAARYRDALEAVERLELGLRPAGPLEAEAASAQARLNEAAEEIEALSGHARTSIDMTAVYAAAAHGRLVYVLAASNGGLALIVDDHAVELLRLKLDRRLADALLGFGRTMLGDYLTALAGDGPFPASLDAVLDELGTRVMTPLLKHLGIADRPVVLIPVGRLAVAPLHAARCTLDGAPRWALEWGTLMYAPSAAARMAAIERAAAGDAPAPLLAVGDPERSDMRRLKSARTEATDLARLLGVDPLVGPDATRDAVWRRLRKAGIAHFACHGRFLIEDPMGSSLLLTGEDELTARQLVEAPMDQLPSLRLAVMSACRTSLIDWSISPDEAVGLTAGFLQAGVPAVVGTLWAVDDASTSALMRACYQRMHDNGESVAEALRCAQLQFAAGRSRGGAVTARASGAAKAQVLHTSHPYFWAGFVAAGAADLVRPVRRDRSRRP